MTERSPWLQSEERLRVERALQELGSALVGAEWQGWQMTLKFAGNVFQCMAMPPLTSVQPGVFLLRWPVDDLKPYAEWTEPEL